MMIKEDNLFKIGLFAKPHGIKGEIALITDYELDGISGEIYVVCNIDGLWTPFFINSYRQKNRSTTLVTFDRLDSEDKVKFLTGKTAFVPSEWLPPADEYPEDHWSNVIGYTVVDDRIGSLGQVTNIDDNTLNILLKVDYQGNEILIPWALVKLIRHEQKSLNLSLPEGFLEIYNQHETKK